MVSSSVRRGRRALSREPGGADARVADRARQAGPSENASLFISIAAPLISIARMIASSDSGIAPFWNAKPSMKALVAMLSPISAVARPVASRMSRSVAPTASLSASRIASGLEIDVGIDHEARGRLQIGVDDGARHAALGPAQRRDAGGDHDVAAEHEIGAAGRRCGRWRDRPARARSGHGS